MALRFLARASQTSARFISRLAAGRTLAKPIFAQRSTTPFVVGAALAIGLGLWETRVNGGNKEQKKDYEAVKKALAELMDAPEYEDGSKGPLWVRLAWHASGTWCAASKTGGSDGATMRFAPESQWGANAGLKLARDDMEKVKQQFPWISYADLWTLAGSVAIEQMGGPQIKWRPGRSDAVDGSKIVPDGRLPDALQKQDHLRSIFGRMGFNDQEIVALSGAHSLGRCHTDRSGFSGPWTRAPTTLSNEYFRLLLEEKWVPKVWNGPKQFENANGKDLMMLPSDLALIEDPTFKKYVELYAKDEQKFFNDFASAWTKLIEFGVKF